MLLWLCEMGGRRLNFLCSKKTSLGPEALAGDQSAAPRQLMSF